MKGITKEEREWTDLCILLLLLSSRRSSSSQTGLLLLLRLGAVLIQKLEPLRSSILTQCVRELDIDRRDLKILVKNDDLPFDVDVFGPFDETGEISLGSDDLACNPI